MRISVTLNEYQTHYEHDGEQYGSWSSSWDTSLGSVIVVDEDQKLNYPAEGYRIADGSTKAYILWMTYSTGDSFGSGTGCGAILGVFGREEIAKAAYEVVKTNEDAYSIKIKDDFDREISIYNPGSGYFESVENIYLDEVTL